MAFTNVPAARAALFSLITARPALSAVQVLAEQPGDDIDANETIFLDRVRATQDWAQLGHRSRDEEFTIELIVLAGVAGPNAQATAEARAWVLLEECEQAVRSDITLAGNVFWAGLVKYDLTSYKGSAGWLSEIVAEVGCRARVTG